jgi:hypothetical protein
MEIGRGLLQNSAAADLRDDDLMVVYRGADGRLFIRAANEFYDGRFTPLPAPPEE